MTKDDFNAIGWRDFVVFSFGEPLMRKAFTEHTGIEIPADIKLTDNAINPATGVDGSVLAKFIEWVTRTQWGIESAPKAYREALAQRKA